MMRNKVIISITGFFLLLACKPLEIIKWRPMTVMDDITGFEKIEHVIYRYHREDTLQYILYCDCHLIDYPSEISSVYVSFFPEHQSGFVGLYERSPGEDADNSFRLTPLYQYHIAGSAMYFRKPDGKEEMKDMQFASHYKDSLSYDYLHFSPSDTVFRRIYRQINDVGYQYFNGRDTLANPYFNHWNVSPAIPMFALPLNTYIETFARKKSEIIPLNNCQSSVYLVHLR
jgi:hypothetical protein